MKKKKLVIFIVGPTASGKSKLALMLAKKISGEIICCDSMQVYKEIRILSQRPSQREMQIAPHHLYGIISVKKKFDAHQYSILAKQKIEEIHRRGNIPIVVGGTGFYVSALLDGIFEMKSIDINYRKKLYSLAKEKGSTFLHKKLQKIDKKAAKKIHPHDLRRIIRALEVYKVTGRRISQLQKKRSGISKLYKIKIFAIDVERDKLYERINQRIEEMFSKGAISEIKKIKRFGQTARYALGIREIKDFLNHKTTLEEAKSLLKRNSRRYAKRQLCWFKQDNRIKWLKETSSLNQILRLINN